MPSLHRLVPLTGAAGIALVVAGLAADRAPTSSWSDERITTWYAEHGTGQWLASAVLVAAAVPLLLVFTADLTARAAAHGAGARAQSLIQTSGTAFSLAVLGGAGLYAAVPAAMTFGDAPAPAPDVSRFFLGGAYGELVMFSAFAAAVLAATVSVVALSSALVPRWLAVAGLPAALLMLANAVLPMAVITLWFTTLSVALAVRDARRTGEGRSVRAAAPASAPVPGH